MGVCLLPAEEVHAQAAGDDARAGAAAEDDAVDDAAVPADALQRPERVEPVHPHEHGVRHHREQGSIRKHIAEREAAAKSGPIIVDAEVLDARNAEPSKKGGGLMGWFTKLQEKADQIREDAERQARQKKR